MRRLLIWNDGSGKAEANRQVFVQAQADNDTQIHEMTRDGDLKACITQAVEEGCEVIMAAGGDGTVNAVVNAMMFIEESRRPRLAILPLGTANDFAATLTLPDDISQTFELSYTDQTLPIDVVKIHAHNFQRYFANIAAGGNSVRVSEELTDDMKARWGAFCYLRGGVPLLADLQTFHITAQCDSEKFSAIDSWAVLVANGKTNAGRIVVAPNASPNDGLLEVIIIRDGTVLDIVDIISHALLGSYLECEQVIYRQVRRLQLHSEPSMRFTIDGEVIEEEPVEFEVVPGAVCMFVGDELWAAQSHQELARRLKLETQQAARWSASEQRG